MRNRQEMCRSFLDAVLQLPMLVRVLAYHSDRADLEILASRGVQCNLLCSHNFRARCRFICDYVEAVATVIGPDREVYAVFRENCCSPKMRRVVTMFLPSPHRGGNRPKARASCRCVSQARENGGSLNDPPVFFPKLNMRMKSLLISLYMVLW